VLTELRVRDLLVIDDVTLPLEPGLNVLTGETGAGKSMLVDALALLLGERASGDSIRPGADRAVVEAAFDVRGVNGVPAAADEAGVDVEDDRIVVRRAIRAEGRNRAWVNGSPATVGALAALGQLLVDLHGQHETQSLLRPSSQREMLDAFGDCLVARARVAQSYQRAEDLRRDEQELVTKRDDVLRRADYLRHVVKEIEDARPKPGEDETLEAEHRRLANVEELTGLVERLLGVLEGGTGERENGRTAGAAEQLAQASRALDQLERFEADAGKWSEMIDAAIANVEELALAVREYAADIDQDPKRLAEVERRRDVLYRLTQKYGPSIEDVVKTLEASRAELDLLDTADLDLEKLRAERAAAEEDLTRAAGQLTALRQKAATRLAKDAQKLLPGLGMPEGRFTVRVTRAKAITASGADEAAFIVQLNPGLEARPLAQVASGGELSRLMLALKVVLAAQDAVPTLIFDEVDQGIGGEVAVQVADALAEVARSRQVLVITHLPQIAARAAHHLAVSKRAKGGIATADVRIMEGDARVEELARMLGDANDQATVRHAAQMLKKRVAVKR
jgi:DNA repair protein RecN (Recombination protein N)